MKRRRFIHSLFALPAVALYPAGKNIAAPVRGEAPEILLQESPIAGFQYYDGELVFYDLYPGMALELVREPDNKRDSQAIEVQCPLGKLGYVPRAANTALAQMMDRRVTLHAELTQLTESADPWQMARFKVWV